MTHPSAALRVVSRFRVPAEGRQGFLTHAATAMDTLAAQPGCRGVSLGQATDDAELLLITSEWEGVGAYRRGLSSFDVKLHAVPLLSMAVDEPSAFEIVRSVDESGEVHVAASGLAEDAGRIGLGEAAGPDVRPVTS